MKTYCVHWKVEIEASSPKRAAEKALDVQRDPCSKILEFEVVDVDVKIFNPVIINLEGK